MGTGTAWISPDNYLRGMTPDWDGGLGSGYSVILPATRAVDDQPGTLTRLLFDSSADAAFQCVLSDTVPIGVVALVASNVGSLQVTVNLCTGSYATVVANSGGVQSPNLVDGLQSLRLFTFDPPVAGIDRIQVVITGFGTRVVDIGEVWAGKRIVPENGLSLLTPFGLNDPTEQQFSAGGQGYTGDLPVTREFELKFNAVTEAELIGTEGNNVDSLYSIFGRVGKKLPVIVAPTDVDNWVARRLGCYGLMTSDLKPTVKGKNTETRVYDLSAMVRETR